jgi:hypothetical protein
LFCKGFSGPYCASSPVKLPFPRVEFFKPAPVELISMENKWRIMLAKKKQAKVVVLEKDFAGIKAGSKLYVATPKVIDQYIRSVPSGQARTIERLRNELARKNRCTATCPVSTAIFVRISAEAALEELAEGKSLNEVAPFWRVIDPDSKLAARLTVGPDWVATQRAVEVDGKVTT